MCYFGNNDNNAEQSVGEKDNQEWWWVGLLRS